MDQFFLYVWRLMKLFWYSIMFVALETFDLFIAFAYTIQTLFFSFQGLALISLLVLSGFGIAAVEHQVGFMEAITIVWCRFYPIFLAFYNIIAELAPISELLICLYDAIAGFMRTVIAVGIDIAIHCTDPENWIDFLKSIPEFLLALGSSSIDLLANPLDGNFTIISENPDERTPWSVFQTFFDFFLIQADCQCSDLGDLFDFVFSILRKDDLGWTLHYGINSVLAFGQAMFNVLVELQFPDLSVFFDRLILFFNSSGDWVDGVVQDFIGLFTGSVTPPDLAFGCTITRVIGVGIELVALVVNAVTTLVNDNVSLVSVIEDLPLKDLVGRVDLVAECVTTSITVIDPCLGDAAGKTVSLVSVLIEFFARIIQQGVFLFGPVSERFFDIWGDQTYDSPNGVSHVVGITSPFFFSHAMANNQTGLVCFLKNALGGSDCAVAAADLASAVGQTFALPVLLADQILSLDFNSISFNGNPANDDNRDQFSSIFTTILSVVPDRLVLDLDYTGHLFECIPGVSDFGVALEVLAAIIQNLLTDIIEFVVIVILLIYQVIIWFISLLGSSPFDGEDSGSELVTLFSIFSDFFIFIWDVISSWLTGLIDYTIFPWFATFFGQNSLLADTNPGTARFTTCFTEIEDCLCGLTKASIGQICMGALGCLSSLWPDCGDFEPGTSRRRSTLYYASTTGNTTIWGFWALNFNDTVCGPLFNAYYENPPRADMSIGESDGMELLRCVNMAIVSGDLAEKHNLPSANYLMSPDRLHASGREFADGLPVLSSAAMSNAMLAWSDPARIRGRPDAKHDDYYDHAQILKRHGITDPTAVQTLIGSVNAVNNMTRIAKRYVFENLNMSDPKPNFRQSSIQLGARFGDFATAGGSLILSFIYESRRASLFGHAKNATTAILGKYWSSATDGQAYERQQEQPNTRKRSVHATSRPIGRPKPAAPPEPDSYDMSGMIARLQSNHWPVPITPAMYMRHRMLVTMNAFAEYRNHFLGRETLMPRYNAVGDLVIPEGTIPLSCTRMKTNCSADLINNCQNATQFGCAYNSNEVTCTGETLFIPHHDVCNEFFGTSIVAGICGDFGTVVDFYLTEAQCKAQANNEPGNHSAAFLVAIPNTVTCLDGGPTLGVLCLDGDGCTDCPIEQVFPGFTCALLDETRYHIEDHLLHCIDKLGLGPGIPQFPTNITAWEYDVFFNPNRTIGLVSRCGNGLVEPDEPVLYRNPFTHEVFNFSGEECDPPNSINNQTGVRCGPACQIAVCGNGILDPGEVCDDGNLRNGDTCTSQCTASFCGNGIIDAGEDCDDGNTLDYDGCSRTCKVEICPQIRFTEVISSAPFHLDTGNSELIQGTDPKACFRLGTHNFSVEIICTARIPVLWAHDDFRCWSPPVDFEIKESEADTDAICVLNEVLTTEPTTTVISSQCILAVQTGNDFSCSHNCSVCGNGITETHEQCDDGTKFPTGNPIDDECILCKLACQCHPDRRVPCTGICVGPVNTFGQGTRCDPRNDQCGDGLFCMGTSCCGDLIVQSFEECDDSSEPLAFNSTCVNCILLPEPPCQCQPGLPCMGLCYGTNTFGRFAAHSDLAEPFAVQSGAMAFQGRFPCDVSQGVFACPGEGEVCVPFECCGDGILPTVTEFCETTETGCNATTCNMIDSATGLIRYTTSLSGNPVVRLYGFRDHCHGIFPATYDGTCGPTVRACKATGFLTNNCEPEQVGCDPTPDVPMPIVAANFTARVGICYDVNGFAIRPVVACMRSLHSTCEYLGLGSDSYCVAEECCGDGLLNTLGPSFASTIGDSYGSFSSTCQLEENYPGIVGGCTCQTNRSCVGVCTYNSMPTERLCDPTNSSNTPWCPTDTNQLYGCVAIFCCGDGIVQADYTTRALTPPLLDMSETPEDFEMNLFDGGWGQYWNPIPRAYGSDLLMDVDTPFDLFVGFTGETCEGCDQFCGLGTTLPGLTFTRCEPQLTVDGLNFALTTGNCIDPVTGDEPFIGCDYYSPVSMCPPSYECWPQQCCGDGVWNRYEICDPTVPASGPCTVHCNSSTLAFIHPLVRRKREAIGPEQVLERFARVQQNKRQAPLHELAATDPRQLAYEQHAVNPLAFGIAEADYLVTYESFNFSQDFLSQLTFNITDFIGDHAGAVINSSSTFAKIEDFFTDTNTDNYVPMAEKGFLGWLKFEFTCIPGLHTTGQLGVGLEKAIHDLIKPFLLSALFVGAATAQFGGVPASIILMISVWLFPSIFLGYAFGFPFPWCLPLWPENFVTELVKVGAHLNHTTVLLWDQLITSANEQTCSYTYRDCRDFGLFNGLDYFLVMLQNWFPDFMQDFFNSTAPSMLGLIPGFTDSFARVQFPNGIPEDVEQCVNTLGWLVIFEFAALTSLFAVLAPILIPLIGNFLSRLGVVLSAAADAFIVAAYVDEDPVFM